MPFKARNNPLSVPALLPLHPLPALPAPSRPLWAKAKLTLVRSLLHLSRIIHIFNIWNERRNKEKRRRVGLGTDESELSANGKLRSSEIRECCQGTLKEAQTTQNPTKHPKEGEKSQRSGTREASSKTEPTATSSAYRVSWETPGEGGAVQAGEQQPPAGFAVRGKEREKRRPEETHLKERKAGKQTPNLNFKASEI